MANCAVGTHPTVPSVLQSESASLLEQLMTQAGVPPDAKERLARFCVCSPFAARVCLQQPELLPQLLSAQSVNCLNRLTETHTGELHSAIGAASTETAVMQVLRRTRDRQLAAIVWFDRILGIPLPQTLSALSQLAETCIAAAADYAHEITESRFGEPRDDQGRRQKLLVLAMGKLGGAELNFSSDIDLILAYPRAGQTAGKRQIDNSEFFRKLAQTLVRLLAKITEHGFVYRVDLRLRPFGESGPLVLNFDALEQYYLTQGREWERYAMIKVKPIYGDPEDCAELMTLLKPFVYRRYLDYSAIESLRDLKQRITAEVNRKGMQQNIKLGPGGIREIEFIAQAFQLVRGGRETSLQSRSLYKALREAGNLSLLPATEVSELLEAYEFLRYAENCLQMVNDQQTHSLPDEGQSDGPVISNDQTPEQLRLAYAMGFANWPDFMTELRIHQDNVMRSFAVLFKTDAEPEQENPYAHLFAGHCVESNAEFLQKMGFERSSDIAENLRSLSEGSFYRNLSAKAESRVDALLPQVLASVLQQGGSYRAFDGLLKLLRSVAGRSAYLQVLIEQPAALHKLTRLFASSSWLADFVSQHPIVIDELLNAGHRDSVPDYTVLSEEIGVLKERLQNEELDVQMDALRQFRQAAVLRVAVAELEGNLDLMKVSDNLSWIAELILNVVCELVWTQLTHKHGIPMCRRDEQEFAPGFAVVAYGKLGGLELAYASDLDLVFLHESEGEDQQTNGERSVENPVFFARLAQKVVHFINTLTPAGVLYDIDTRLRPNGQSGMLVSGFSAFAKYQAQEAWVWEHQALVRARVVVGNERIRSQFDTLRKDILCRAREILPLRQEVVQMRERMRESLGSGQADSFDLKQDAGGIADIEFMVQYVVLLMAAQHPELAIETDNYRILERVEKSGNQALNNCLDADSARDLRTAYLALRRCSHSQALLDKGNRIELTPELDQHVSRVKEIWQQTLCAT